MPALPPVSKVIRFDHHYTVGPNSKVQDRIFLSYSGALSNTDLATLLATMSAAWNTNIAPLVSTSMSLTSIQGTDLTSASSAQQVNTTAHPGTSGVVLLPMATAIIVKFHIGRRYRGGHPRYYLPGLGAVSLADADHWTASTLSNVSSGFAAFIAASILAPPAAVGVLVHVNVSYFSGFSVVTNPVTHRARNVPTTRGTPLVDSVLSYSANPNVGSQRRRNQQSA